MLKFARLRRTHMIDLTNKTVDEINGYIQKYASVLELIKPQEQPYMAYIIDVAVNYIKEKYNNLTIDWKSWCTLLVKEQYFNKKLKSEKDIKETIDNFVEHWIKEYNEYCNNLGMYTSEYDRDRGFVYEYMWKKNR